MRSKHRFHLRLKFSKKLWDRWLERLNGPDPDDPQYVYLSEGIQKFRASCALKEKFPL